MSWSGYRFEEAKKKLEEINIDKRVKDSNAHAAGNRLWEYFQERFIRPAL